MTSWPPFPREIEGEPCAAALRARLDADAAPLWRESTTIVPLVHVGPDLATVLAGAARMGTLVLGLEAAETALDREEEGLAALAARPGGTRTARLSRILLVANDGAERFYRMVDRVTRRHASRLLTCRLDVAADALGIAVLGRPAGLKAVLLQRRPVVTALLRAIASAPDA